MKIKNLKPLMAISALFLIILFGLGCFLSQGSSKTEMKKDTVTEPGFDETSLEEIQAAEGLDTYGYLQRLVVLGAELEEAVDYGLKGVQKYEQGQLKITDMDNYIKEYIEQVEEVDAGYRRLVAPEGLESIDKQFNLALEHFRQSVSYLYQYLDTSLLNINKKIEYLQAAFQQIQEGKQQLDLALEKIDQYGQ
ncbi:MAG: hypothetical protein K9H14_02575 [Actinomycetia bacterium]|nr:hypothetical protein [Actinomycetes bacterium]